jgi:hypothetical protein
MLLGPLLMVGHGQAQMVPFAKLDCPEIDEMSGIACSRSYPDVYWVHNDSGDSARIFAIHRNGRLISPRWANGQRGVKILGAKNVDWEDIAIDGKTLYISDLGNNGNKRKDLCIYVVPEPDPWTSTQVRASKRIRIAYPDQTEFPPIHMDFDCESLFVLRGKIFVFSKDRLAPFMPATSATLYRLDSWSEDRVNVLTKIDRNEHLAGWVTAADASPDGKTIAFLTHWPEQAVYLCPADVPGGRFLSSRKLAKFPCKDMGQCEALAFDGTHGIIIGNEEGELFQVPVVKLRKLT